MLKKEIRKYAMSIGIEYAARMRKTVLIRAIQSVEGKIACFNEPLCKPCRSIDCTWGADCTSRPAI